MLKRVKTYGEISKAARLPTPNRKGKYETLAILTSLIFSFENVPTNVRRPAGRFPSRKCFPHYYFFAVFTKPGTK